MDKISIIIPIYNAEKYLKECLDSLIKQEYGNVEIILVNDGSKDSSKEICMQYLTDKRIVYVEQINGGVSKARNLGLSKATGEYIAFIDSDDMLVDGALGQVMDIIEKFNGEVPSTIEELMSLAGVGKKTANVVYSVAFGGAAIAVDTHVFRVSRRIGLYLGIINALTDRAAS